MKDHIRSELEKAYEASKTHKPQVEEWKSDQWEGIKDMTRFGKETGIPVTHFKQIGEKITMLPDDYNFHPTVKKIYGRVTSQSRRERASTGAPPRRWASLRSSMRASTCASLARTSSEAPSLTDTLSCLISRRISTTFP